jgi:oligopeptide transport system ATP-binding protein
VMPWMILIMPAEPAQACLEVRGLSIHYGAPRRRAVAAGIDFHVGEGECLGIVGESGSGKSQTCLAIMDLLPREARVTGSARLRARELLSGAAAGAKALRGRELAMVFQDPMTSLTPHMRIGTQLTEVLHSHLGLNAADARARAIAMLEKVRIADPAGCMRRFPHELSGGMRQRVMIAMACLCRPALLIADEPTTALDATVQAQVLGLLRELRAEFGMALLLVTHDFALLAGMADRVIVMYAGCIVECAPAPSLFTHPLHPYARGLIDCVPRWPGSRLERLPSIAGQPPAATDILPGCAFAPRCSRAGARCTAESPALRQRGDGRLVACHFPHE